MSDYKITFTLRQHTPLIHFQHDQAGATLRATELKPKLDKYIATQMGGWENLKHAHPNWLVGKGKAEQDALNYKVKVSIVKQHIDTDRNSLLRFEEPKEERGQIKRKLDPAGNPKLDDFGKELLDRRQFNGYFGNMDKETLRKELEMADQIKIEFFSNVRDVIGKIRELFPGFIHSTNFGTRQSKGFGSFTLDTTMEENKQYFPIPQKWFFTFQPTGNSLFDREKQLFERIDWLYRSIRSGLNLKLNGNDRFYFKSMMYHYAQDQAPKIHWDKPVLRHHFFSSHPKYPVRASGSDYPQKTGDTLFRDLLGLSSEQEWGHYNKAKMTKAGITLKENGVPEISRYKSPLIFKPVFINGKFFVYLLPVDSVEQERFKKEPFQISVTGKPSKTLKPFDGFTVNNYLNFCFNDFFKNASGGFDEPKFLANIKGNNQIEGNFLKSAYKELLVNYNKP